MNLQSSFSPLAEPHRSAVDQPPNIWLDHWGINWLHQERVMSTAMSSFCGLIFSFWQFIHFGNRSFSRRTLSSLAHDPHPHIARREQMVNPRVISVLRCRHLQTRKAAWMVPIWKFWRFRTATTTVVVFSAPISCLVFAKLQRGLSISFFEALCRNKISKIFSILLFLYFDATVWEFLVHLSILMWNFNFYKGLTWKMMNRFSSVFK